MSVLPPFDLTRPDTLDEALGLLSFDDMPIAGGTELLLAMRMRVIRPASLVDLKRITELKSVSIQANKLIIGGGVTHQMASTNPLVRQHLPILSEVLDQVGNPRIRASGTLAGNLIFAEPKSDVIPILLALNAQIVLRSSKDTRSIGIDELILGPYYSAREPDELLTEIQIPVGAISRAAYLKFQTMERPTVGVAALDSVEGSRRIVVGAVGEQAHVFELSSGEVIDGHDLASGIDPIPDLTGSVRYKRHVTGLTIDRVVNKLDSEPTI